MPRLYAYLINSSTHQLSTSFTSYFLLLSTPCSMLRSIHLYNLRSEFSYYIHQVLLTFHHDFNILIGKWRFIQSTTHQFYSMLLQFIFQLLHRVMDFIAAVRLILLPAPCEAEFTDASSPLPFTINPGAVIDPGIIPNTSFPAGVAPFR